MQARELRRLVEAMVWAMDQESARLQAALRVVELVAQARPSAALERKQAALERERALEEVKLRAQRVLLYAEFVVVRVGPQLLDDPADPAPAPGAARE